MTTTEPLPPFGSCSNCMCHAEYHTPVHIDVETGRMTYPCRGWAGTGCRQRCQNFSEWQGVKPPW